MNKHIALKFVNRQIVLFHENDTAFVDHLWYLCLIMLFMLSRLFIVALLWSPAGKGLTSRLLFVIFNCVFVTFPCSILGQVWYLIVSIPDLYRLPLLTCMKHQSVLL